MQILYTRDNKGFMRVWEITLDVDRGEIVIQHGMLGRALQTTVERVPFGRANRTQYQQMVLQANARIKKQLDKGYTANLEEAAGTKATNSLMLPKPMLAQVYGKVKPSLADAYLQYKYDGNRCLIANVQGELIAYSRTGQVIRSLGHILKGLVIPEGAILDGEIYCHGESLQTICSWVKREQASTSKLEYMAYDVVSPLPFAKRFEQLESFAQPNIKIARTIRVATAEAVYDEFAVARIDGYEGIIVRTNQRGYEDGKRSATLLKLKEWQDDEFEVVSIDASKDGWAILYCITRSKNLFKVTAPGPVGDKIEVLTNAPLYIGKHVTVEYAYLTADGIPFHPVAKVWRF
jgi:DNA ligase 1